MLDNFNIPPRKGEIKMKKLTLVLLLCVLFGGLVFAQSQPETASSKATGELVLYSSANDEEHYMIVDAFQKKYPNIKIEVVQGSTGELLTRERAEASNPHADIQFGGLSYSNSISHADILEYYISPNDKNLPEAFRSANGLVTLKSINLQCLLVHKALEAATGVTIESLDDILNPALKGKISFADPNLGSTAFKWLTAILYVKGNGNPESKEAWDYVEALIQQLDGKLASSTGNAHKNVKNGEYVVGFTSESNAVNYLSEGFGDILRVVYPKEGTTAPSYGIGIIKNCKNLENAKLFVDFIISEEGQEIYANSSFRPADTRFENTSEYIQPISTIKLVTEDNAYLAENQKAILDKFNNLWAKYN